MENSLDNVIVQLVNESLKTNPTAISIHLNNKSKCVQIIDNGTGFTNEDLKFIGAGLSETTNKHYTIINQITRQFNVINVTSRHSSSNKTYSKKFIDTRSEISEVENRPAHGTTVQIAGFKSKCTSYLVKYLKSIAIINHNISFTLKNDASDKLLLKISKKVCILDAFKCCLEKYSITYKKTIGNYKILLCLKSVGFSSDLFQYPMIGWHPIEECKIKKQLHELIRASILKQTNQNKEVNRFFSWINKRRFLAYIINFEYDGFPNKDQLHKKLIEECKIFSLTIKFLKYFFRSKIFKRTIPSNGKNLEFIEKYPSPETQHALSNNVQLPTLNLSSDITKTNYGYKRPEINKQLFNLSILKEYGINLSIHEKETQIDDIFNDMTHSNLNLFEDEIDPFRYVQKIISQNQREKHGLITPEKSNRSACENWDDEAISNIIKNRRKLQTLENLSDFTDERCSSPKDHMKKFCIFRRPTFVPKGMSPILHLPEKKSIILKQFHPIRSNLSPINSSFKYYDNGVCDEFIENINRIEISKNTDSVFIKNQPVVNFHRDMLNSIKVIDQIDKKFICVIMNDESAGNKKLLVLFDQHAVDERIRLENIMKGFKNNSKQKQVALKHPIKIKPSSENLSLVCNLKDYFNNLGVTFEKVNSEEIEILSVPYDLYEKDITKTAKKLVEFIMSKLECDVNQHADIADSLLEKMKSEACHGAIKFGNFLSKKQCEKLLIALSKCDLPFQCAHGRPSLAAIIQIEDQNTPVCTKLIKCGII